MKRRNFIGLALGLLGVPFLPKVVAKPFKMSVTYDIPPMPIGYIPPPITGPIPEGCVLCDGRAISRLEYNELFNLVNTVYGQGDGLTTFNVPDLTAQYPVVHAIVDPGHYPAHTHSIRDPGHRHGNMLYGEYVIKAK